MKENRLFHCYSNRVEGKALPRDIYAAKKWYYMYTCHKVILKKKCKMAPEILSQN